MTNKPVLSKISNLWGKRGKHKNALTYHPVLNSSQNSLIPPPMATNDPLVSGLPGQKTKVNWLVELREQEQTGLVHPVGRTVTQYEMVFDRFDELVCNLLQDMATAAKWGRLMAGAKSSKILKKQGQDITGWGWVIYRVHSAGEAVLPEDPTPQNYTLFNFWQVTFAPALTPELEPDLNSWTLHAVNSLPDFERLTLNEVERWLKQQLYQMHKGGCLWVALPNLMDERGKSRKPTIEDALLAYNVMSYGRCYDPFQTEAHFYDRPPYQNQFIPGFFKR